MGAMGAAIGQQPWMEAANKVTQASAQSNIQKDQRAKANEAFLNIVQSALDPNTETKVNLSGGKINISGAPEMLGVSGVNQPKQIEGKTSTDTQSPQPSQSQPQQGQALPNMPVGTQPIEAPSFNPFAGVSPEQVQDLDSGTMMQLLNYMSGKESRQMQAYQENRLRTQHRQSKSPSYVSMRYGGILTPEEVDRLNDDEQAYVQYEHAQIMRGQQPMDYKDWQMTELTDQVKTSLQYGQHPEALDVAKELRSAGGTTVNIGEDVVARERAKTEAQVLDYYKAEGGLNKDLDEYKSNLLDVKSGGAEAIKMYGADPNTRRDYVDKNAVAFVRSRLKQKYGDVTMKVIDDYTLEFEFTLPNGEKGTYRYVSKQ
jgi:hypothetical protein